MILFLTSSPTGPLDQSYRVEALDYKNHFVENLKHYLINHLTHVHSMVRIN